MSKSNSRSDTIALLKELKKEIDNLSKKRIEEAAEQVKTYATMLEGEQRRRGK